MAKPPESPPLCGKCTPSVACGASSPGGGAEMFVWKQLPSGEPKLASPLWGKSRVSGQGGVFQVAKLPWISAALRLNAPPQPSAAPPVGEPRCLLATAPLVGNRGKLASPSGGSPAKRARGCISGGPATGIFAALRQMHPLSLRQLPRWGSRDFYCHSEGEPRSRFPLRGGKRTDFVGSRRRLRNQ